MSDTPRTDAWEFESHELYWERLGQSTRVVHADKCRELERELDRYKRLAINHEAQAEAMAFNFRVTNKAYVGADKRVRELESAVRWALGYDEGEPQFFPPKNAKPYWWRKELRRRAALNPDTA